MRMKFKLFLVLVTIQIGCTGVPLFAHPNFPAKASRNAATEIHGHRDGVPQFWRQFEDPMLNRLIADGSIMPRVTTGNTMAPCIIIGERAAEALRNDHRLETSSVSRSRD